MNEIIRCNINTRLRNINRDVDWLADQMNITRSAYFYRLRGNITLSTLSEIADALGCRVVELLVEPCEQIVQADCENNEPVTTNLIECPNCGAKMVVTPMKELL